MSNEKLKCKHCGEGFNKWRRTENCYNCDDGIQELSYPYDGLRDEFSICTTCKGNGELTIIEDEFCSEECLEDYYDHKLSES